MVERSTGKMEKGFIKGELLYTIFQNEHEHFSIAKIKILETNERFDEKEIVGKGYIATLQEGVVYNFFGQIETHPKFGKQYQINAYETFIPDTRDGLIAYLSSELFYGIGKKTATRIIDTLGLSAISKILDDPSILSKVPQLKKETGKQLVNTLKENQGFEHVVLHLSTHQIGLKMSQKIYEKYKEEAIQILQEDPYQFVFDIEGFGFQMADNIARQNGLSLTHPNRIGAGCIYTLQQSTLKGHVFLPIDECITLILRLLKTNDVTKELVVECLEALNQNESIVIRDNNVYLPSLYYAETGFNNHLQRMLSHGEPEEETTLDELLKIIGEMEERESLSYGEEQFEAIHQAIHSKVTIVTGGPGTGKTTVIKGILNAFSEVHGLSYDIDSYDNNAEYPFILTAPTGRAAKRLSESTGLPAVTIHRLLGWNGLDKFDKNEDEPLQGKYIIIDEFSMVDIWLANNLFKAIPNNMQVLLVGDEDQLPSVGPGQVLSDLIHSGKIPLVKLNEVYRQQEGSKIIQLAHLIKNDQFTLDDLKNDQDFSFIRCREHQIVDVIKKILLKAKEKGISLNDIQILAPLYKTRAGINEINNQLQQIMNPKDNYKRERKTKDAIYRVGDKVIQLVNQPEDGVANGDIGEIVAIFEADENKENEEQIVISFDDKETVYLKSDYRNFTHAFCISIHKSQGSEFPIVILPVVSTYHRMLRKNLLYTAITRSKESLIICGEEEAFLKGIETLDMNRRYTTLPQLLGGNENGEVVEQSKKEDIDEDDISPYDFM